MLTNLYSTIFTVLLFLLMNNSKAQNYLTHNTGTIAVSMFDHGYIGHTPEGITGTGVIFNGGPDPMFTAGFVAGYSYTKIIGAVGNFMQDWVTTMPYGSFTSNSNFDQIATASYNDNNAPITNRIGLSVIQKSLSNTGDDYIIIEYTITNNSNSAITDFYAGAYANWDVGYTSSHAYLNQGGYDLSRNLAYQFENGGAADTKYYGLVALNGLAGAKVLKWNFASDVPYRDSVYQYISTFLSELITIDGDYITFIGSGPYNLGNGDSVKVGLAVVAGTDLADLQANADSVQIKWNNMVAPVEVELEVTAPLKFALEQNYPNPFNPSTTIRFGLPEADKLRLDIFNILGEHIVTLLDKDIEAGSYNIPFDAANLSSGIYIYRLQTNNFVQSKKMLLIK